MDARTRIMREAEIERRAELMAQNLGLKVNPFIPESFERARQAAEKNVFGFLELGAAASPENIAASAYLLQRIEAICPNSELKIENQPSQPSLAYEVA